MNSIWLLTLKIFETSLLAILVTGLVFFITRIWSFKKNFDVFETTSKKMLFVAVLLFIFGVPYFFTLISDWQFFLILSIFVRELIVSIIIALVFWTIWVLVEDPAGVKQAFLEIGRAHVGKPVTL